MIGIMILALGLLAVLYFMSVLIIKILDDFNA